MNLTSDHLADILIGIARAQNAIIDAIDRANPGFRSQHAAPMITLAANMRAGDPRMIDLSSRILVSGLTADQTLGGGVRAEADGWAVEVLEP